MGGITEISEKRIATLYGKILLLLLLISSSLNSCKSADEENVPYYNDANFTPFWAPTVEDKANLHKIGAFSFTNQYGREVSNQNFKGKVYLASFFFTSCPSICPKLTNTMKMVFDNFKGNKNVLFLSHSVTPDIDSVSRLYDYAKENQILSKQWHLVTGDKSEIYNIARKGYFIEQETGLTKLSGQFLHTENFVLIDADGHIRGIYNGTLEAEVPRIIEDINFLIR
ncbi:MAG: SCO family protein [Sphingobacteriaceae bacterium]|nr:SCO family protein [Sphingobacteriaceae bacterium]